MRTVVITSVRNGHEWLRECVESCIREGFTEICVYDDASEPPQVVPEATVLRGETSLGAYHARAAVLDALAGNPANPDDLVCVWVDGDDWLKPGTGVRKLVETTYADSVVEVAAFSDRPTLIVPEKLEHQGQVWKLLPGYMRTHRLGAYRRVRMADPAHLLGRDTNGNFTRIGTDRALLAPMILAAPSGAYRHISCDVYGYRVYPGMTHHFHKTDNREELCSLARRLFPERFEWIRPKRISTHP